MVSIRGTLNPVSPRQKLTPVCSPRDADVLEPAGDATLRTTRFAAVLRGAPQPFLGAELGRVERRHRVRAVAETRGRSAP